NGALINRMGCPSVGLSVFGRRMASYHLAHAEHWGVVGVNLGINADTTDPVEDCRLGMQHIGALCDYVVLNLSSPNTEGLRALLKPETLRPLIETVMTERETIESKLPALVVKISPDIADEDIAPVCKVLIEQDVNGVILTNTTTDRPADLDPEIAKEKGGLSGRPLRAKSTGFIERFYKQLNGQIPIIGCGGVDSAEAAYEKIKAGACLVQLYTGLVMKGPELIQKINTELDQLVQKDGFNSVRDAIGSAHRN
ncbi:MAG: dihydroorotate dehydrogenase (quinone), partial [Pseudomonadota bacterium]